MITGATKPVRLPEAVTVRHGPVNLLSQFFLAADQYVRDRGVRLYVSRDMDEFARISREQTLKGDRYPVLGAFRPDVSKVGAENAYWIGGMNADGETVVTQVARLYRWGESCLADHAEVLLYGDTAEPGPCIVECPTATHVRGNVAYGGALWIRPDFRRLGIGTLISQISRAYAMATWGVDWFVCLIQRHQIELGMAEAYGYADYQFSIRYPGSPWGDVDAALARQAALELLARAEIFISQPSRGAKAA